MTFDQFRETIRVGIVAGIFGVKDACTALEKGGWHTTRDVPDDQREKFLESLNGLG